MTETGERQVAFNVEDGTRLVGTLVLPAVLPAPLIVMAHGFSGVREQIVHYARAFADAGFVALTYDHRGFGGSDGLPRQEIDPAVQIADWRDAISWGAAHPQVLPEAPVGIWGSSFAGGLAMVIAANDPRIGCVVAQIPNVGGHVNGRRMFNVRERAELDRLITEDRAQRLAGGVPALLPVMTSDPDAVCALPPAMSPRYIAGAEQAYPSWVNAVTVRSVEHMLTFEPAASIRHIAPVPLMMIVGAKDTCTFPDLQLACFAEALEPKRLVIHPGGHFDTYTDHFTRTSGAAAAWFRDHLPIQY